MSFTKHIFVDIDETLLHTEILYSLEHDEVKLKPGQAHLRNWEFPYVASLREGALELLKRLREIPNSKVYALTTSVNVYANGFNEAFGFGWKPEEIYAREALQSKKLFSPAPETLPGKAWLIDDRSAWEQDLKIDFISSVGGHLEPSNYIQVTPFFGYACQHFNEFELERIVSQIRDWQPTT